ncbi:YceD family protein [Gaoshiqia sediminis]|uniref:DUF177 domain-containing protein n=1 Tax=Gaoshiqia sediminis TaxID=2986998 RepID=A0AA41Y1B9_9BACT|nr:DUF177 domain-containing protein [Gaoshiqia sediminis]MCW0481649.1 DUF177 domain-containing protein [Gaoshiqia sediminis]
MAELAKYNIAFKGLAQGVHQFEYQIDKKFFDFFAGGIAEDGNVLVKVELEKQSAIMVLWFHISGTVKVQCDRCLDWYDQPIKSENQLFIKYGEESFEEGDDVIWVSPNDHQINVGKLIYDFIILSIPIKQVHPDDENGHSLCNPDMLEKLNQLSGPADKVEHPSDSRWDDLKKLLENE